MGPRTLAGMAILGAVQCQSAPAIPLEPPEASSPPVEASTAFDDAVAAPGHGSLDGPGVAYVHSLVSGRIAKVDVAVGDHVTKGQELAVLRSSDDDAWAWGEVHKAEAELIAAQHDYERQKVLFELGEGRSGLQHSEDAYRRARAERDRVRATAFPDGGRTGDLYRVVSPVDGEVLAVSARASADVCASAELFTIGRSGTP